MFKDTQAFSGFSVNDIPKAKAFYGQTLGLDVTEANGKPVDLVIGMKFPAYLVEHPRKVLWVIHQYRSAYDMAGTDYDDLAHGAEPAA